jgi:hypothetical protein
MYLLNFNKKLSMKKDIPELKVEDMAIVIAPPEEINPEDELWDAYLINFKDVPITNVLVVSKGYGEDEDGVMRKTSTLRHFFDEVEALGMIKIEPISTQLLWMSHEYWVSFTCNGHLYDKKYVFVVGSIEPVNFINIPFINRKGVMIR